MYDEIKKCRISGSTNLIPVVNLGEQSITGIFIKPEDPDPISVPLDLVYCPESMFLQLRHTVDSDLMYSSYWYRSGTNQTMRDHLKGVTDDVTSRVSFSSGDICIDTGCNDGTLLKSYDIPGLTRIGMDPSNAIEDIKPDDGITAINNYFTAANAKDALSGKKAKVITSISMFYDLDNPASFVEDVKACLADDGVWVVEMNYTTNMIRDLGYDMIGQEHVAYYTLLSFEGLVSALGLYVNDVSFNSINGGSIRIFVSRDPARSENVVKTLADERKYGLDSTAAFEDFGARINSFKNSLVKLVNRIRADGMKIAAYGASTRGNTVMQHCGFTREHIYAAIDRNPMKYGMEMSGCRIPIISEEQGRKDNPEYIMILPYYFLEEFLERESEYLDRGGKFIVYLPKLRIISKVNGLIKEEIID